MVPGVGLVVTVYDILDISGGDIYPSDGAAIFDVQFRLVAFLPFVGEVIIGRLIKSTRSAWRLIHAWRQQTHARCTAIVLCRCSSDCHALVQGLVSSSGAVRACT